MQSSAPPCWPGLACIHFLRPKARPTPWATVSHRLPGRRGGRPQFRREQGSHSGPRHGPRFLWCRRRPVLRRALWPGEDPGPGTGPAEAPAGLVGAKAASKQEEACHDRLGTASGWWSRAELNPQSAAKEAPLAPELDVPLSRCTFVPWVQRSIGRLPCCRWPTAEGGS